MSPSKKPLKEKIVQYYVCLFRKQNLDLIAVSSNDTIEWNEFFLLKANCDALKTIFENIKDDDLKEYKSRLNLLFDQSVVALIDDNQIKIANASFCTDNINDNPFIEHLMSDELFDACVKLLSTSQLRQSQGYQIILLLTIFVSYRSKSIQNVNPFTIRLSILDNEVALNGYAQVLSHSLLKFNRTFDQSKDEPSSGSILSTLTSMVGSMFVADDDMQVKESCKPSNSVLLAFYKAVHLNRNFISLLTNSQTDTNGILRNSSSNTEINNEINSDLAVLNPPSNLLVTFLEFCSIVMLHTKDEANTDTSRLCFIILTCISEDQCANAIMHDINIVFKVQLHRMRMRHRKLADETTKPLRPLSYSVLDLMVEFIVTHLRKTFLLDLFTLCLGVIRRLLCYQKRCKIRFNYAWRDLWFALIALLRYITIHEADLLKKWNIFALAYQTVNIFNLFITYGDTFLPSPQTYDDLYYEIIRMHSVFDNLYALALRYSSIDGAPYRDTSARLANCLINIKAIITHFNSKIETWSVANQVSSLTEAEVLEVIRNNYDSLTLKLQDGLDLYETYSPEKSKEAEYFAHMVKSIVIDFRENNKEITAKEQQAIMHEVLAFMSRQLSVN
ncbi:hypothetical protein B4U79_01113 [Dinothrombium tinctorium]|uniref:Armadillo-like helical domain-containing protein n=1 Tax=Dinothrombium tinctorium TaxID=1965070 RepID=A0A3S3PNC9_9ACAR|nr:hypothetical protein B4U79_01113 [Dinothrombium tinctorium]